MHASPRQPSTAAHASLSPTSTAAHASLSPTSTAAHASLSPTSTAVHASLPPTSTAVHACGYCSSFRTCSVNTWGSGYLMTSLGASILKVSVTDRGGYWATSSEHFPHTAPRTPFSTYTRLKYYPFWTMPA